MLDASASGRRVALIVGNGAYATDATLANAVNDASSVARALDHLDFDTVSLETDADKATFERKLADFGELADGAELALFYFAGHGLDVSGRTYLLAVDGANSHVRRLAFEAISLDDVLAAVGGAKRLGLVILDACRTNPLRAGIKGMEATRSVFAGLAPVEPIGNTLVVYSAKHGTVALDGSSREHSPFTEALLDVIDTPNLDVRLLFGKVKDKVARATNGAQEPHVYGSLGGDEVSLNPLKLGAEKPSIFISYAREDRDRVASLAAVLQIKGWDTFWDQELVAGDDWRGVVERHLKNADCVIAAWSEHSIRSEWVHFEVGRGLDRGILVPISLDGTLSPGPYASVQTMDLSGWNGTAADPALKRFIAAVERSIAQTARRTRVTPPPVSQVVQPPANEADKSAKDLSAAAKSPKPSRMRLIVLATAGCAAGIAIGFLVAWPAFVASNSRLPPAVVERIIEKRYIERETAPVVPPKPELAIRPEALPSEPSTGRSNLTTGTIPPPAAEWPKLATPAGSSLAVVGSFKEKHNAEEAKVRLSRVLRSASAVVDASIQEADIPGKGHYFRVVIGSPSDRASAQARCAMVKDQFAECFVATTD